MSLLLLNSTYTGTNSNDNNKRDEPNVNIIVQKKCNVISIVLSIIIIIFAVKTAIRCNPENPWLFGVIAFFFPEIYLLQFGIRKYLIKEKGYCKSILGSLNNLNTSSAHRYNIKTHTV